MSEEVQAAGGIVERDGLLVVVHRPRYDDWSLPKGKLDPGESFEQAAQREILEETGLHCSLGAELAPARYCDHRGREKLVRYWRMTIDAGAFEPNDEVDELRWLTRAAAIELLSYEHDRLLVQSLG